MKRGDCHAESVRRTQGGGWNAGPEGWHPAARRGPAARPRPQARASRPEPRPRPAPPRPQRTAAPPAVGPRTHTASQRSSGPLPAAGLGRAEVASRGAQVLRNSGPKRGRASWRERRRQPGTPSLPPFCATLRPRTCGWASQCLRMVEI